MHGKPFELTSGIPGGVGRVLNVSKPARLYYDLLFIVVIGIIASSCSEDSLGPYDENPYNWTDRQIAALVYSHYGSPPDFYKEDYRRGNIYYENTISIRRVKAIDDYSRIELCSDSRELALAWSESSAVNSAYYRTLESATETEKYYEFRRVWEDHPTDVLLSRVHKCGYLDRSMYDSYHPTSVFGVYGPRPITAEAARELVEYMWANGVFEWFWDVFNSETTDCGDSFCQIILYATTNGGDWGTCDEILLREATVRVHKESGEITCERRDLRSIRGRCYDDK